MIDARYQISRNSYFESLGYDFFISLEVWPHNSKSSDPDDVVVVIILVIQGVLFVKQSCTQH